MIGDTKHNSANNLISQISFDLQNANKGSSQDVYKHIKELLVCNN